MKLNKTAILFAVAVIVAIVVSCDHENNYLPKPRGYFRIDLPEKGYSKVDTIERYSFEYPEYALITPDPYSLNEKTGLISRCRSSKAPSI